MGLQSLARQITTDLGRANDEEDKRRTIRYKLQSLARQITTDLCRANDDEDKRRTIKYELQSLARQITAWASQSNEKINQDEVLNCINSDMNRDSEGATNSVQSRSNTLSIMR